jgi:hypothetical protein
MPKFSPSELSEAVNHCMRHTDWQQDRAICDDCEICKWAEECDTCAIAREMFYQKHVTERLSEVFYNSIPRKGDPV